MSPALLQANVLCVIQVIMGSRAKLNVCIVEKELNVGNPMVTARRLVEMVNIEQNMGHTVTMTVTMIVVPRARGIMVPIVLYVQSVYMANK